MGEDLSELELCIFNHLLRLGNFQVIHGKRFFVAFKMI